jgi:hypothetical protein
MPEDTIADVAERLDRCAERFRNAKDQPGEKAAHEAAAAARSCGSVDVALRIERAFLLAAGITEKLVIPPPKPKAGVHEPDGKPYVNYGETVLVGGSRTWRNNNPGYLPCTDAVQYDAIGCDGRYAIFLDEDRGRWALAGWLRAHYPNASVHDALKAMIPSDEIGPDVLARIEKQSGIDASTTTDELSDAQLYAIGAALQADPSCVEGEEYDINIGTAPEWVEQLWEQDEGASDKS